MSDLQTGTSARSAMRRAFEARMSDNGQWPRAIERAGDSYLLMQTASAWTTWQAAWEAAQQAQDPALRQQAVRLAALNGIAADALDVVAQAVGITGEYSAPAVAAAARAELAELRKQLAALRQALGTQATPTLAGPMPIDAARWQAMRQRLVAVDFAYGEPPQQVVCFVLPAACAVYAGPEGADAVADAAIAAGQG